MFRSENAIGLIGLISLAAAFGASATPQPAEPTAARLAAELRSESRRSFERGLMPLPDYLESLAVVEAALLREVEIDVDARPWPAVNARDVDRALAPRLNDLRAAVARLKAFRQPAAEGYTADLALAEYALRDAELQAAYVTGTTPAVPRLSAEREQAAVEHYRRRVFDYNHLGHASLPSLVAAATMLNVAPQWKLQVRQSAVARTRAWSQAGAGIGRSDRVTSATLDLAVDEIHFQDSAPSVDALAELYREADQFAQQLQAQQEQYFERGTASLSDLTRSWQWRWQLQSRALRQDIPVAETAQARLDAELATLKRRARQVTDLRGRMRADVLRVELLGELHAR